MHKAARERSAAKMKATVNLSIEGMHCENCVESVEKALAAVPGVQKTKVSLAKENAKVVYDSDQVCLADLEQAVTDTGFGVRGSDQAG